jgi:hypothetical protein
MVKWILEDDCLREEVRLEYTGINPIAIYKASADIFKKILRVGGSDIWERDFRWDSTEEPRKFFVRITVKKKRDERTKIFVDLTFQGTQPSDPTKEGSLEIKIRGRLRTEYSLESAFKRSLFYKALLWLYEKVLYDWIRASYIKDCTEAVGKLVSEYRAQLGLPPR